MQKFIEPKFNKNAFTCPYCNTMAQMKFTNTNKTLNDIVDLMRHFKKNTLEIARYYDLFNKQCDNVIGYIIQVKNIHTKITLAECQACENISIWLDEKMVFPTPKFTLPPNEDLSENIKKLYIEASAIVEQSPCGACAILRLALQKMFKELNLYKKDLNTSIGELIQNKKINKSLLQALEIVRVCGNNAVHEGVILLDDDKEIAKNLFKLINFIAEELITKEKKINELYANIPNNKKRLEQ